MTLGRSPDISGRPGAARNAAESKRRDDELGNRITEAGRRVEGRIDRLDDRIDGLRKDVTTFAVTAAYAAGRQTGAAEAWRPRAAGRGSAASAGVRSGTGSAALTMMTEYEEFKKEALYALARNGGLLFLTPFRDKFAKGMDPLDYQLHLRQLQDQKLVVRGQTEGSSMEFLGISGGAAGETLC